MTVFHVSCLIAFVISGSTLRNRQYPPYHSLLSNNPASLQRIVIVPHCLCGLVHHVVRMRYLARL